VKSATQSRSGASRGEPAVDQVGRLHRGGVGDGGALDLAPHRAGQSELAHQWFHGVPGDRCRSGRAFPVQRQPHLPGPIDAVVGCMHSGDVELELPITLLACSGWLVEVVVVGRRGNPQAVLGQHSADRLHTPSQATGFGPVALVCVDELHDHRCGRSSSAAKKLEAALRIALARRSSAFSRRSRLISAASSLVTPAR
jgi:hypothetical protein